MTAAEIHEVCRIYKIKNYTINDDGSIDVDGDVFFGEWYGKNGELMTGGNFSKCPVKFGNVSGDFYCSVDDFSWPQLISLEGSPHTVGGNFCCENNKLTSLVGGPETVGGDFWCRVNRLTSLIGAPRTVGGNFDCSSNKLSSLKGSPSTVGGAFYCHLNYLTSLDGGPTTVSGNFNCCWNNLTSLNGISEVGGRIHADGDLLRVYERTRAIKEILES